MELDALLLARMQFAANITFHILFPSITIALGWVLLFLKLRFNKTKQVHLMHAYELLVKVFALSFALGVVSGLVMSFQFGTNWPGFMQTVGNVAGPLLGYEVLSAFYLEATFLGIMLFGKKRVSNKIHTLATFLVAFGTTLSAFWILALNSWMQTPDGVYLKDGIVHVSSWLHVVFNPSFPYRFVHMLIASALTCAFLVAGLGAYSLYKAKKQSVPVPAYAQYMMHLGLWIAAIAIPIQIATGDLHGTNTLKHQPAKLAAMEGYWSTQQPAPAIVFALPNAKTQSNDYQIAIPNLASLYLTHSWDGAVKGVKDFDYHPPVAPVFFAFRIMVGVGLLMLAVSWSALYFLRKLKKQSPGEPAYTYTQKLPRLFYPLLIAMTFCGWIGVISGWYVSEIGRQPWLVYGILTTAQAASTVPSTFIAGSLSLYLLVYALLLVAYVKTVFYLAYKKIQASAPLSSSSPMSPLGSSPTLPSSLQPSASSRTHDTLTESLPQRAVPKDPQEGTRVAL